MKWIIINLYKFNVSSTPTRSNHGEWSFARKKDNDHGNLRVIAITTPPAHQYLSSHGGVVLVDSLSYFVLKKLIARTRWLYHLIDWHDQVLRPGGVGESSLQCLTWCPFSGVVTSSSTTLTDRSQSFIKYRWAFSAWRWWTWLRRTGDRTHIFNGYIFTWSYCVADSLSVFAPFVDVPFCSCHDKISLNSAITRLGLNCIINGINQ